MTDFPHLPTQKFPVAARLANSKCILWGQGHRNPMKYGQKVPSWDFSHGMH